MGKLQNWQGLPSEASQNYWDGTMSLYSTILLPTCQTTLKMRRIIICDTSCFIILSKIGELEILQKLYGEIITTPDIAEEFGEVLPDWVKIESAQSQNTQKILETQIDKGESSAIALALELTDSTLILDDFKARKIAHNLGLNFTGTIGIIVKAKLGGSITSIKPILEKIKATDFRISSEIEIQALNEAGE